MDLTIKSFLLTALMTLGWNVFAGQINNDPMKLVPGGEVVQMKKNSTKIKTSAGTIVEIELYANGELEEASGHSAANGDVLIPAGGLMSLAEAVSTLDKQGKKAVGEWSLEKTIMSGWVYEFDGFERGQKIEYRIDAVRGELLSQKFDD